jgi:hypothetical protein
MKSKSSLDFSAYYLDQAKEYGSRQGRNITLEIPSEASGSVRLHNLVHFVSEIIVSLI